MKIIAFVSVFLCAQMLCGVNTTVSVPTTQVFEKGGSKLIVYSDVPGLAPSEFYTIKVRSAATNNQWIDCFALITRNMISSLPPETKDKGPTKGHYQKHTTDWSHTYGNIEMSPNLPVEVEISRKKGAAIKKATTHPSHKAGKATVVNGKAYFTIDNPSPITIDIDGQMDDQHTGEGYSGPAIHTISLFANPIMEKPAIGDPGVVVVKPGEKVPAPDAYTTLYFAPGIHDLGRKIKVHPDKNYYIPGDAIVYGTFNNIGLASGHNIQIYGVGTISGDRTMHPLYDDDHLIRKEDRENWKSISINDAINVEVKGVCVANPAEHSIHLAADGSRPDKSQKVTFARWAKVISWRANGDGIGSTHVVEDCFLRCADDCSYIRGDRRRCVFWKDTNAAVFHMAGIPNDFPIVIEDCDVLYNRSKNIDSNGGGVFVQRTNGATGQQKVNVLIQNFRVHDKFPTMSTFNLVSQFETGGGRFAGNVGSSYSGITFRNITVAAKSVAGRPERIIGCAEAPWNGGITFDNVVIAGKKLTSLKDLDYTNKYVTNITFISDNERSSSGAAGASISEAPAKKAKKK